MPTVADRLRQVTLKVERANQHFAELQKVILAFIATNPYRVAIKVDADTRRPIYFVESVEPVPEFLSLLAGDVIQNLMSALDHLAYQLVCSDTLDNPPNPNWIYFPIQDDVAKYDAKKTGKMEGAAAETIAAIDTLKPYKQGNDLLWMLFRLNNIEKHRLLLTVGACAESVNLTQSLARLLPTGGVFDGMKQSLEGMNLFFKLADKGFPLKPGFELYIGAPDESPDPNQQFRFDVALTESGIIESKSLHGTLDEFGTEVMRVVEVLAPRLRDNP
jgi:hypothetical protein